MRLSELVCPDAIITETTSRDRDAVIGELVASLGDAGAIDKKDIEKLVETVIERENEASTGIGKGVAVPHARSSEISKPVAAIALCKDGLDFSSLDKQPVYSVFLLVSPKEDANAHVSAMEVIFKNLQKDDFRSFLKQANSVSDILELLEEADSDAI